MSSKAMVAYRRAIAEDMRERGYAWKHVAHQLGMTKFGASCLLRGERKKVYDEVSSKACNICIDVKPIAQFYRDSKARDGHSARCKTCHAKVSAKWYAENPEKVARIIQSRYARRKEELITKVYEYREKNPEKIAAHDAVKLALYHGKITKQPCEVCGSPYAQGHHDDYNQQLDVRWLCARHHKLHHLELKKTGTDPDECGSGKGSP